MKAVVWITMYVCSGNWLLAQEADSNQQVVTRQCSAIRELVYSAANSQFEPFRLEQVRGSHGYQTMGTWQFATTRFSTTILWQGADLSYIEHYEESTDSSHTDQWQYIAEYSHVPDVLEAERLFRQLNNEIAGCVYPLNDTTDIEFKELPPGRLPVERPASLEIASLYELPLDDSGTASPNISIMVGMEKRAKDYRVSLIVENMLFDNKPKTLGKLD